MHFNSEFILPGVLDITDSPDGVKPYVDMYLIEGSEKAILIDAGVTNADLAAFIRKLTDKPVELVLTHGHHDHTMNASQFDRIYMSHRDMEVLLAKPMPSMPDTSRIINLEDGDVFELGGCRIEALALPGHTCGSFVLLDRERQLLFAGDAMGSGDLWMQLPHSTSVAAFLEEMRRFERRLDGLDQLRVFLGHNCLMSQKPDRQYITDARLAAEGLVTGRLEGLPAGDRPEYRGGMYVSFGQMKKLLYQPDRIF